MKDKLKVHIVAAATPPAVDGIGDYTAHLARELAKQATVKILTAQEGPDPVPGVEVVQAFSIVDQKTAWNITSIVEVDKPDWLLVQYNPFCFGRRGFNLHIPEAIRACRKRSPGTKIAVMAHEPYVPLTCWQFYIMTTYQRWQLWRLGRSADIVFFSIDQWVERFTPWFPNAPVLHLPVGSNIGVTPTSRQEARNRLGIADDSFVLGFFGTIHISRNLTRIQEAAKAVRDAGRNVLVLYIGPHSDKVKSALADIPLIADGPFPADEISRRFPAMDAYLAPFHDGISTRRGSFMCALAHGIPIVGTVGELTDKVLKESKDKAFLLADADDGPQFSADVLRIMEDAALRSSLSGEASRLFETEFSWQAISNRMLKAMATV